MEKTKKKSYHILRYVLLALLVVCAGALCGFSLSNTGQGLIQDTYGRTMEVFKQNSTKQTTLNGKSSGTLTYKETMNRSDAPANSRSDNYGTYDVYADENGNEYVYLLNSDTLCGYKAKDATDIMDYTGKAVTKDMARETADAFMQAVFGDGAQKYQFESIEVQDTVFYVDYCFYLNGARTDDQVTLWIRTTDGAVSAWHAFNRGRYDGYASRNLSTSAARAKLEEQIPIVKSADYEIFDQYITKTDDDRLVMHYDIVHHEDGISKTHTYEAPLE